jgi:uncharacterized Zn finger protein
MHITGKFKIENGIPTVDSHRVALRGVGKPYEAAIDIIVNLGLTSDDHLEVDGTQGRVAGIPVLFLGRLTRRSMFLADGTLAGNPVPVPASVLCKACGTVNSLPFVDPHNLPVCVNKPPQHKLKVY